MFNCLAELIKPPDTELLIITDGNAELEKAVNKRLDSISFSKVKVISYGKEAAKDINERRYRIADIHNLAKTYVPSNCDLVFCIEDDTVYPTNTLEKLQETFNRYEDCAYAEGVEVGRHKTPYIGGWLVDDIDDPFKIESIMPPAQNINDVNWVVHQAYIEGGEPIDAGGLYCALINALYYRYHDFEPFDKEGKVGLGCDVELGIFLRRSGYGCYVNWDVSCDHIGEKGSVNLGNVTPVKVVFEKRNNEWSARTE